jgi:hypothetical protein
LGSPCGPVTQKDSPQQFFIEDRQKDFTIFQKEIPRFPQIRLTLPSSFRGRLKETLNPKKF